MNPVNRASAHGTAPGPLVDMQGVWVGHDLQNKRKERTKIQKGSGEMEEENVEGKSEACTHNFMSNFTLFSTTLWKIPLIYCPALSVIQCGTENKWKNSTPKHIKIKVKNAQRYFPNPSKMDPKSLPVIFL